MTMNGKPILRTPGNQLRKQMKVTFNIVQHGENVVLSFGEMHIQTLELMPEQAAQLASHLYKQAKNVARKHGREVGLIL